ncbi:transmembrane emp24 domain-containing protein 9-like [Poecilia latipinna]|uniref:Transmembrane p24 trafficking protein 9 n=1 Tax=Poecilia formosa TaxID=48698 RepID=A0A087XNE3_POEFO|nr:PREDICTED: transmembrane emp24 domain-containing protein 9-like [Poecilia formosa]XP_014872124.1 PREDICTED: transmembrane emp24 domain-containing protein 9-like [Poecilia latipinna]
MESGSLQWFMLEAFLVNCCLGLVSSLYFHMTEGEQKCFIEEIPADTIVVGDYWTQLYDEQKREYLPATRNLTLSVAARTPTDKLILSHKETKGRFNFTSFTSGEHKICLQPSLSQPLSEGFIVVVRMDIRSGERTNNYTEIQKRELLTQLQLRVRRLSAQVHDIHKELIYSRSREKDFLAINHNINMWIYWWPIIRSVFVVIFIIHITNSC